MNNNWSGCFGIRFRLASSSKLGICLLLGAIMGGPTRDEVMKKIPGRQGHPGPHP